ncbi:MAG: dehydrogenase [Paludibacteraceae bacterium]|nr:dehydrogenase [Bacteroidales bacterium]
MADNYLERHYEDYEKRKQQWRQKHQSSSASRIRKDPWSD